MLASPLSSTSPLAADTRPVGARGEHGGEEGGCGEDEGRRLVGTGAAGGGWWGLERREEGVGAGEGGAAAILQIRSSYLRK